MPFVLHLAGSPNVTLTRLDILTSSKILRMRNFLSGDIKMGEMSFSNVWMLSVALLVKSDTCGFASLINFMGLSLKYSINI